MHKFIAFIFALFAALQYNDPDYYIWMPTYLAVSILIILFDIGKKVKYYFLIVAVVYGLWMLSYIPEVLDWIQNGLPSITGSMQAESPFIEFIREFFGLAICLTASVFYWSRSNK